MEKLTNVQREERKESARAYVNAEDQRKKALEIPQDLSNFARTYSGETSDVGKRMREELASGRYEKPSDFAKAELSELFGTLIPEALVPSYLYEIDSVRECPFTDGWYRRRNAFCFRPFLSQFCIRRSLALQRCLKQGIPGSIDPRHQQSTRMVEAYGARIPANGNTCHKSGCKVQASSGECPCPGR